MKEYSSDGESNPDLLGGSPERYPIDHDGLMEVKMEFYNFNLLKLFSY